MAGDTDIYGILGHKISYSRSPLIFSKLFQKFSIDAVYKRFDITEDDIETFVEAARVLPISAFNVTIPYKEKLVRQLDKRDAVVTATGSVNLIINRGGRLHGFNTDYAGIAATIEKQLRVNVSGRSVAVLGSGGSARTVLYYLMKKGAGQVAVFHHSSRRKSGFDGFVGKLNKLTDYESKSLKELTHSEKRFDLCINCTPSPISKLAEVISADKSVKIFELRYAGEKSLRKGHVTGEFMLATQAAENFRLIFGKRVAPELIMKILRDAKR